MIGSPSSLDALVFFNGPVCFVACNHFKCADMVLGSAPFGILSILGLVVTFGPLSSSMIMTPPPSAFYAAAFTASGDARTSSNSYSLNLCCARNFATTFCL